MSALLQGVPIADNGGVLVTNGSTVPDHVHSGIPYEADGSVAVDYLNPANHFHQGLGYTSVGRLAANLVATVDYFGNGAAPFSGVAILAFDSTGPVSHYSSGVPYVANGRIFVGSNTSSTHTMFVTDFGAGVYGYIKP